MSAGINHQLVRILSRRVAFVPVSGSTEVRAENHKTCLVRRRLQRQVPGVTVVGESSTLPGSCRSAITYG